ncbi:MAG TPA: aminotransferase class I/II-fold pyridoxal phosphate-dependent enzyme [Steroidobacteraceae bacterium]|nr:aminotransferase class I/II-fold pyridoxal phosphate-dependent enzyme [Steroidobacteraceae bacterium]HRX88285.1 aminotransferase class I/II-fold pyridoxal phosphate-dependent enzyme [Steroidobacteraceae bacterium]
MSSATLRGASVPPFHAGEIGRRVAVRQRAGLPVIGMHFGQPSAGAPAAAIRAAHRALDSDPLGYWESEALRERLAQHYQEVYSVAVEPGRILLTAGASAALVACFAAMFRRGDSVAILRPGYPAYRNTLRALGLNAVEISCGPEHRYRLTAEMVARLEPAPTGLILASPANPTGAMLDRQELAAVIAVCKARGILLLSDEIYHGISYGARATSALECDSDAVVINSFSKLYRMPGWRLGWLVVPQEWTTSLSSYLINMFLTPSSVAQYAALAAFDVPDDLRHFVAIYARNRLRLAAGLESLGIRNIQLPDGAFYLYADLTHLTHDSLQFCRRAVDETGVALAPGIDFDTVDGRRFVRFSFAVSEAEIDEALRLLAAWLPGYRDR